MLLSKTFLLPWNQASLMASSKQLISKAANPRESMSTSLSLTGILVLLRFLTQQRCIPHSRNTIFSSLWLCPIFQADISGSYWAEPGFTLHLEKPANPQPQNGCAHQKAVKHSLGTTACSCHTELNFFSFPQHFSSATFPALVLRPQRLLHMTEVIMATMPASPDCQ